MFEKVEKIFGVTQFVVGQEACYLHAEEGIICSNGFELSSMTKGSIYLHENWLFHQSFRGELNAIDLRTNENIIVNNEPQDRVFINPYYFNNSPEKIYITKMSNGVEEFGEFDLNHKIFNQIDCKIGRPIKGEEIGLNWGGDLNSFDVHSLNSGKLLWYFDKFSHYTNSIGENTLEVVSGFIGVYDDILWISLSSGSLVGLNKFSGSLMHKINRNRIRLRNPTTSLNFDSYIPFGELAQLDEGKGEIFGLRDHYFIHLDLNTSELTREYITIQESMNSHKITSNYRNAVFPCVESYVLFCDDRQGKLGVFDREKREVVWSHSLDIEHNGIAQILEMDYANGRWYVLDRNNTLHVLERI